MHRLDATMEKKPFRAVAAGALAALLAISLAPVQAFAVSDEGDGAAVSPTASQGGAAQAENSWRYEGGVLLEEAEMDAGSPDESPSVVLLADDGPEIIDDPWTWQGSGYVNPYGDIIPNAKLKGIDVSEHQKVIDWDAVANSDIDYAIIRCGYGSDYTDQDDLYWVYNVTECAKHGIPFGVYLYSYATDVEMAKSEARHVLRLLDEVGYTPTYPIYLDLEDSSILDSGITAEDLGDIAEVFCTTLEREGYMAGVYANLHWWTTYLTDSRFDRWERWVAQYNVTCDYAGAYTMWQCTSSGVVPGIEGRVDLNFDMVYRNRNYGAYYDVSPGDWYVTHGFFDYVVENDIMHGDTDENGRETGYFRPAGKLTREQFLTILYRCANPDATDTTSNFAVNTTPFADNYDGNYYTAAINWAYKAGVTTGYDAGASVPMRLVGTGDEITREDVATMIYRYARSIGVASGTSTTVLDRFPDAGDTSDYACQALAWCYQKGIITGVEEEDGTYLLKPKGEATRAEMVKIITVFSRDVL